LLKEVQAEVDMEDLVERAEKFILPSTDCGRDNDEVDLNEINDEFGKKSDEDSDDEKNLQEKGI